MIHVGLSLMIEEPFRRAVLPLFEAGLVDALEHSFEIGWDLPRPDWAEALLDHYAEAGRLWGHGVTMSPLSVHAPQQAQWLAKVAADCAARRYAAVSEHYGFMVAGSLDGGAPLPPPPGPATVAIGVAALRRLAAACGVPVGLENLALALSRADVLAQGSMLTAILDAVDGHLLLDLHNLHCQLATWDVDEGELLGTYPLHRVRAIHLSGGSWSEPVAGGVARRFRRDTHDDAVPDDVHALLPRVLARCPAVQVVVLERLGATLRHEDAHARLRDDFMRIREAVQEHERHG